MVCALGMRARRSPEACESLQLRLPLRADQRPVVAVQSPAGLHVPDLAVIGQRAVATHGGGGEYNCFKDVANEAPKAKTLAGLCLPGGSVNNAGGDVDTWLKGLKF